MKKLLLIIFILLLVFLIYYLNIDRKKYVLSIGDYTILNNTNLYKDIKNLYGKKLEKYVLYGNDGDYRIIDLINDINNNKDFIYDRNKYTLDNAIIKADIIIISIGMNDLKYNKNNNDYDYIDEVINDLDKLFSIIRKYSKEKILVFNYYLDNDKLTRYVNSRLGKLVNKYKIDIIDYDNDYSIINNNICEYLFKLY